MNTVAFACAAILLALPVTASAASNSIFPLVVNSEHFDGSKTYTSKPDKNKKLADIRISPISAVQLEGSVSPELFKAAGIDKRAPLLAGSVLSAADSEQRTYCGKAWSTFGSATFTPCLIDQDGDGLFDHAAKSIQVAQGARFLVIDGQSFTGNITHPEIALSTPIAYHPVDSSAAPQIAGQIIWRSDYDTKTSGPVHYVFGFFVDGLDKAGGLYSERKEVAFSGTPVDVDLFGIKITVVGMSGDGTPICHMEGSVNSMTIDFMMQNMVTHYYFY